MGRREEEGEGEGEGERVGISLRSALGTRNCDGIYVCR